MKLCKKLRECGISSNGRCHSENMNDEGLRRRENLLLPCAHAFAKQELSCNDHQKKNKNTHMLLFIMFRVYLLFFICFDFFLCVLCFVIFFLVWFVLCFALLLCFVVFALCFLCFNLFCVLFAMFSFDFIFFFCRFILLCDSFGGFAVIFAVVVFLLLFVLVWFVLFLVNHFYLLIWIINKFFMQLRCSFPPGVRGYPSIHFFPMISD